tara:strand:- start:49 stop:1341 length:1293 start_codon:yes stop_codon:yes gene_type:complete
MPRNGSGTYTLPEAAFVFDTIIDQAAVNSDFSDIATEMTNSVAKDGQSTMTGTLKMGSQKITGVAVGTAQNDGLTLRQAQANAYAYVASDTGAANAYVIAPAPAIAAYVAGQRFQFKAANASSGASTLNVSGLGVKAIQIRGSALSGVVIAVNDVVDVIYDGTQFQMVSPAPPPASGIAAVVDDTSPQLGGFLDPNSHFIGMAKGGDISSASPLVIDSDGDYFSVTGTTGFAAMTVAANRHFFLNFNAALTMTYHATNLDLPGEANITTAAGDVAECFSTGSNTVQVVNYTKANGEAVVSSSVAVIQVQNAYDATAFTTSSSTYVASGHDDSITVGSGTRVLITATFGIGYNNAVYTGWIKCVETGGPTDIGAEYGYRSSDEGQGNESFTLQFMDTSPGTGSKTYELYLHSYGSNDFQILKVQLVLQELE